MWNYRWTESLTNRRSLPVPSCLSSSRRSRRFQHLAPVPLVQTPLHPARSQLAAPSADLPIPRRRSRPDRRVPSVGRAAWVVSTPACGHPRPPDPASHPLPFLPWRRRLRERRRHLSCRRPALCRRRAYPPGMPTPSLSFCYAKRSTPDPCIRI